MQPGDHSISLTLIRWSIFAFLVLHGIVALVGIWAYYAINSVTYQLPGPDYEIQDLEMTNYRHYHIDSADLLRENRPHISGDFDTTIVEHIVRPDSIRTNIGFSFIGFSNYLGWRLKSTINSDMGHFYH